MKRPRKSSLAEMASRINLLLLLFALETARIASAQQYESSELQITSPANGAVVNPGQMIAVVVTPSSGVTLESVGIVGTSPIGFSRVVRLEPFQFSIAIPAATPAGSYSLTAWAKDSAGQTVVSAPVTIEVP
jgi:hypothetical protein